MARPVIGKAKYGSTQKKFWKLKEGDSVFGILPPLGDLASEGRWSVYYKIHYGYKNAAGKARPFQSSLVENRKTKMIEVPDAANDRLKMLKGQLEAAKASGNEKAKEAIFKLFGGQKSLYNLDNNHYVNAIDLEGNIGILKLRHKAKLALDAEITAARKKNIEPLGVENRCYFVFNRTGSAMETNFKVTVYKKAMNIEGVGEVEQTVLHNLSDDILDRLGDEAAQLDKIFKAPTAEEVAQIVKESELITGVSPNIDAILKFGANGAAAEEIVDEEEQESAEVAVANEILKSEPDYAPNAVQPAAPVEIKTTPVPEPTVIATSARQETTVATSAPAPTPVAKPATVAPASTPVAEQTDKAFLASLGIFS
jgi:hypothetical protein